MLPRIIEVSDLDRLFERLIGLNYGVISKEQIKGLVSLMAHIELLVFEEYGNEAYYRELKSIIEGGFIRDRTLGSSLPPKAQEVYDGMFRWIMRQGLKF